MNKHFIVVISFLFLAISSKSQSVDECRYLSVLTYLRTNTKINERIKGLFSRIKIIKKRDKFVEFNISNRIDFLSLADFDKDSLFKNLGLSKELVNNYKLYYDKYFFKSFRSDFLKNLVQLNESGLFLSFSKPVDNYLIVIIGNSNPDLHGDIRMGLGMKILFKFNSLGLIEHTLYTSAAYN